MTTPSDSVGNVPLDGRAVVEGPTGKLTFDWATYDDRSDVRILVESPGDVIAADPGHMHTVAWTLRQLGEGLEGKGKRFSFVTDWRPGRPNPLVEGILQDTQLAERWRFLQLRSKVVTDLAAPDDSTDLPEVGELDLTEHWNGWASLHQVTLATIPLRGESTLVGVQRILGDPTAPSVVLLGALDPADQSTIIGAATLMVASSTPGSPPVGEVATIAVRPDWQRRGLGTQLLRSAMARFAAGNVRTALTYVDDANAGSLALFAAAGFKERGTRVYYGFA